LFSHSNLSEFLLQLRIFQQVVSLGAAAKSAPAEKGARLERKTVAATARCRFVFRAGGEYAAKSFKFARINRELSDLREA